MSEKRWSRHIARLRGEPDSKALGISFALASELFLVKAENERLKKVLAAKGILSDADLAEMGESPDFGKWLAKEQTEFSRWIFQAWLDTDDSPDVSGEYEKELKVQR